jgi:hypothetical protein
MKWMTPLLILLLLLLGGCDLVEDHETIIRLASSDLADRIDAVETTAAAKSGYSIDQTITIDLYNEEGTLLSSQEDRLVWTISPALEYIQIRTQTQSLDYRYEIIREEADGFHRYLLTHGQVEDESLEMETFDELMQRFHDHIALDLGALRVTSFEATDEATYSFQVDIADVILDHDLRMYLDEVGLSSAYEQAVPMTVTFHEDDTGFTLVLNLNDIPMDGTGITADIQIRIDMTYHDVQPIDPNNR